MEYGSSRRELGPEGTRTDIFLGGLEPNGPRPLALRLQVPVDGLASDYDRIWRAFDQITAGFAADERRELSHDHAAHSYVLGK